MSHHALRPGRSPRLLAAVLLTVVATASPARATASAVDPGPPDPSEHNARVAEYLLLQYLASGERNARVAERMDAAAQRVVTRMGGPGPLGWAPTTGAGRSYSPSS